MGRAHRVRPARVMDMGDLESWGFEEGDEIAPGRHALRLLGGGYRYEAYLAWEDEMLAVVVAKILRPDRVDDRSALDGMRFEATTLSVLQHPVLLRCFDAVLDGPRPHLVLEFLEGPRLSTLLRRYGPLALEQAIPLATQLASALHYMERRGIVHLDVKPRNIIMGGPPRLIDLSVARSAAEASALDRPVGTDAYMAPEQCEPGRRGAPGPASDVWGLGVTVHEAIAGSLPFPEPSDGERFAQLDREPEPLPEPMPPALAELLRACLQPDPAARPSAREVAEALEPLVAALPTRPIIGRLRPRSRRG